jgi:hypothetical protein
MTTTSDLVFMDFPVFGEAMVGAPHQAPASVASAATFRFASVRATKVGKLQFIGID